MVDVLMKGLVAVAALTVAMETEALEQAFDKTPVGEIEVKILPPARVIATNMSGRYFQHSNDLFGRLFQYIRKNDVKMTVPVEGAIDDATMRFYLGGDASAELSGSEHVRIDLLESRRVASFGARGGYSEKNVNEALAKVQSWLQNQAEWRGAGDAYVVYWNGPYVPAFLKRFEVHIPVAPRG